MYLDNAATTHVNDSIVEKVSETMRYNYGNPSSAHNRGMKAKKALDRSRETVANYLGVKPHEIIFTSGGSESNNLAIKGFIFAHPRYECITTSIEHKSVLNSFEFIEKIADIYTYKLKVDDGGRISLKELKLCLETIKEHKNKPFVSIQFANSEVGTVQRIKDIATLVHSYDGILHVDAVQAFGCFRIRPKRLGIDMMSVSGHKFNAPKGIGFLYKREKIALEPLIHGGSQENGFRAGTESLPLIVGLAEAVKVLDIKLKKSKAVADSRNLLRKRLSENVPDIRFNGTRNGVLPGNLNFSVKHIDGEALLMLLNMKGFYVSNGSACNTGSLEPSQVLQALKVPSEYINGTIRITLDCALNDEEINEIVTAVKESVEYMREAQS